jgi:hypothetical protein
MSTAPHGPAAHGAASHAHDHAFDGEPIAVLPADEPHTPSWLPLLGLALFVSAAVAWLALGDASPAAPATQAKPELTAAAVVPPPPPPPRAPVAPAARPSGSAGIGNLTPEQLADLRKRIDEMRSKRGLTIPVPSGAPVAPAAPTK